MAINSVSLSGNLARDPEIKTSGATIICNFCIAVDDNVKNRSTGEWERVPNFFDVTVFGKYGDAVAQRLHKGAKVFVDGKLHYSTWQAQDGSKRSRVSVYADTVETASQASAQNGAQGAFTPQNAQTYQPSYNAAATPATASRASAQNGAQGAFTPQNAQTYQPSYNAAATPATASRASVQAQPSVPPMTQAPQVPPAPQQQASQASEIDRKLEVASFDLPF